MPGWGLGVYLIQRGLAWYHDRVSTKGPVVTIKESLDEVGQRIRRAETDAGRPPGSVHLLAVSKTQPAEVVRAAAQWGQRAFGENYLQEAEDKIAVLSDLKLEWHFIGPIQSNKTATIARLFHWVHSVDRLKIAQRLNDQRLPARGPLQVCIQVNISGEGSKSGVGLDELPALAAKVAGLPNLCLRGLMAIPAPEKDPERQRRTFARLREALEMLNRQGLALDTLSMGMSDDLESAVAEGATWVRIGTALFGARKSR